jgi:hypothetical protein
MSKNSTSSARQKQPKTRWGLEKVPESQRLNEKTLSGDYLDKIRPRVFDVTLSVENHYSYDCFVKALSITTQTPLWHLHREIMKTKIQGDGFLDKDVLKLVKKLNLKYEAYYVDEKATKKEQINLLYTIDHVAILTLEDVMWRDLPWQNLPEDSRGGVWSHCAVWEPQIRRILEPTDKEFHRPSDELQYYDIAHVIEFPNIKTLIPRL